MWKLMLLVFIGAASAKNTFFILVPKAINPASVLRMGVNSLNDTQDLTVTARVQTQEWSNYPYYHYERIFVDHVNESDTVSGGQAGMVELKIPQDLPYDQYTLNIRVETSSGEEHVKLYNLQYYSKYLSMFIQTDKAIYKPGSLVNFRTFTVYSDLLTYTGNMSVTILDPNNNKLKHMVNASDPTGVITNSFKLSAMPIFGHWKIKVKIPGGPYEEKTFEVSNYKLPRFEVTVDMPSYALITNQEIQGKVVAKYTFGEPVKGVAEVHAKIPNAYSGSCSSDQPVILMSFPLDGEGKFTIPVEEIKHLSSNILGQQLEIQAFVTETLTGKKLNGSATVTFYTNSVKINYLDYSTHNFKPGLTYTGTLKVSLEDDLPLRSPRKNVTIYPCVTYRTRVPNQQRYLTCSSKFEGTYGLDEQTFSVPADGLVDVKINIPSDAVDVSISAFYGDEAQTSWTIKKAFSPSDTFLQLELHNTNTTAGENANILVKGTEPLDTIWYEVISRGTFVTAGVVNGGMNKTYTLKLPVTAKMAPHAHVLVYVVRDDGEVVADSINFDVQGLYTNKVSLGFSKNESRPHEYINVNVKADPQSLVSLLVVDQSVTLMASGNDIENEMIEKELKYYDNKGVPAISYQSETDASQVFQDASVVIFTDGVVPQNPGGVNYGHVTATPHPDYHTDSTHMGPTPYPSQFIHMGTPYPGIPHPGIAQPMPTSIPIGMTPYQRATPYPFVNPGVQHPTTGPNQGSKPLIQVERVRKFFPETNTTTG